MNTKNTRADYFPTLKISYATLKSPEITKCQIIKAHPEYYEGFKETYKNELAWSKCEVININ